MSINIVCSAVRAGVATVERCWLKMKTEPIQLMQHQLFHGVYV